MTQINKKEFEDRLDEIFGFAQNNGITSLTINSGELHRLLGNYPGPNHRMPTLCNVMKKHKYFHRLINPDKPKCGKGVIIVEYIIR